MHNFPFPCLVQMQGGNDEKGFAQVAVESISTWAETVGIADLSHDISRLLASDVTYRLRHALHSTAQLLHASKRRRMTPDDFNRALRWMDVPPVLGYDLYSFIIISYIEITYENIRIFHSFIIGKSSYICS